MPNKPLTSLPFDQYSRQKRASEIINCLRKSNAQRFTILDAGGYLGATHLFHSNDSVTVLDVFDVKQKNYVHGDATAMTFQDNSFDFVVSFDVFEHIPRSKRQAFIGECTRVAKRGVIVAAPFGTPQNAEAEVFLNGLFKQLHKKDHQWLKEHIDYRLPEPGLATQLLKEVKLHTVEFPSNYLPFWILLQSVIFAASKFDKVGKHIDALYEIYNTNLDPDGILPLDYNYRTLSVGLKSQTDAKVITDMAKQIRTAKGTDVFDETILVLKQAIRVYTDALRQFDEEVDHQRQRIGELEADSRGKQEYIEALLAHITTIEDSKSYKLARKLAAAKRMLLGKVQK